MNFTATDWDRIERHIYSRSYKVSQIQYAHRSGETWRSEHPDTIRKKIAELQELLQEAGV